MSVPAASMSGITQRYLMCCWTSSVRLYTLWKKVTHRSLAVLWVCTSLRLQYRFRGAGTGMNRSSLDMWLLIIHSCIWAYILSQRSLQSLDREGLSLLTTESKSDCVILVRSERMAVRPASFTSDYRSAPEQPSQWACIATFSRSTCQRSICTLAQMLARMATLSSGLGIGTQMCFYSRPERSTAGSIMSGRLVAAITKMPLLVSSNPDISFSRVLTTRSDTWLPYDCLRGAIASNSSKKMTVGEADLALWKTDLSASSLSPTYLLSSSGPLTVMKLADTQWATALASMVLPQPGGPNSSMPVEGEMFMASNSFFFLRGKITELQITSFCFERAPTSAHPVLGMLANPSRREIGFTRSNAALKSSQPCSIWVKASSFQSALKSAGKKPCVFQTKGASCRWMSSSMAYRSSAVGSPISNCRSSLPGLLSPSSRASGRLVATMRWPVGQAIRLSTNRQSWMGRAAFLLGIRRSMSSRMNMVGQSFLSSSSARLSRECLWQGMYRLLYRLAMLSLNCLSRVVLPPPMGPVSSRLRGMSRSWGLSNLRMNSIYSSWRRAAGWYPTLTRMGQAGPFLEPLSLSSKQIATKLLRAALVKRLPLAASRVSITSWGSRAGCYSRIALMRLSRGVGISINQCSGAGSNRNRGRAAGTARPQSVTSRATIRGWASGSTTNPGTTTNPPKAMKSRSPPSSKGLPIRTFSRRRTSCRAASWPQSNSSLINRPTQLSRPAKLLSSSPR